MSGVWRVTTKCVSLTATSSSSAVISRSCLLWLYAVVRRPEEGCTTPAAKGTTVCKVLFWRRDDSWAIINVNFIKYEIGNIVSCQWSWKTSDLIWLDSSNYFVFTTKELNEKKCEISQKFRWLFRLKTKNEAELDSVCSMVTVAFCWTDLWWRNSGKHFVPSGKGTRPPSVQTPCFMPYGKSCQVSGMPSFFPP